MYGNDKQPILIVDDDPANREVLNLILSSENLQVEEAVDGEKSIEMVGKKQYRFIIMDIIMPRMNGYEAVKKIREMGISTPIIMQSSLNSKEEISLAFNAGCNEFITKPYDFNELSRLLRKYALQTDTIHKEIGNAQQYLDIAGVILVVIAADQTVSLINIKGSEILGYSINEIIGKNWFDSFIPKKNREQVIDAFYKIIAGNISSVRYFESSVLTKSGEERIILWHNTVIRDPSGNIFATLSSGEDVTERRKAEEALRQSEEKYRTLFESMPIGVVYQNINGEIFSVNPAAENILGLTFDQMQGRTSIDPRWRAIHEDGSDFPGETHPSMMALKTGKEIRNVVMGVFNPHDENYHWINIHAVPQFRPGESISYQVYTSFEDITERMRIEKELKERIKELNGLYNLGKLIEQVKSLEELFHKFISEIVPLSMQFPDKVFTILEIDKKKYSNSGEYGCNNFPTLSSPILVNNEQRGNLTVGYTENLPFIEEFEQLLIEGYADRIGKIIERMEAEEELKEYRIHLEKLVELRTWELLRTNDRLRAEISEHKHDKENLKKSQEQLHDLSTHLEIIREEERKKIAREVHDELGTALTSLQLDLFWIGNKFAGDNNLLLDKINGMSNLVNKTIKTVQRISSELRPALLDELGLIAEIELEVAEYQKRTGITIEMDKDIEDIVLNPDLSTSIYRIFQEALTNIARHAKATVVKIIIQKRGDDLVLEIIDNGMGITEEQIKNPKSFGLISMKERLYQWNGNITINGIQGKGTTILINIPLKR